MVVKTKANSVVRLRKLQGGAKPCLPFKIGFLQQTHLPLPHKIITTMVSLGFQLMVIDYVRPDVVAVELCKGRAEGLMNWKPDDDTLSKLFRKSMRAPGGLCMKLEGFICSWWYRRLRAAGKFPGLEFKVAMEESSRVGARCYFIDQDIDVMGQQYSKVLSSFDLLMVAFATLLLGSHTDFIYETCTRAFVRELSSSWKKRRPEEFKVLAEDRDKLLFANLRTFEGKVVAVVGMGHMDGIELLWKLAEEDDNCSAR